MKWIYHKRGALTKEQCDHYIQKIDDPDLDKWFGPMNEYCEEKGTYFYEATELDLDKESTLFDCLKDNLEIYKKKHVFLTKNLSAWKTESYCNLQKFKAGMCYNVEHCEDAEYSKRILAWMFYLNDVKKGGQTFFPQQNFKAKPRRGDLYIWPAGWTHSHIGLPARDENKYIITGWCGYPHTSN